MNYSQAKEFDEKSEDLGNIRRIEKKAKDLECLSYYNPFNRIEY